MRPYNLDADAITIVMLAVLATVLAVKARTRTIIVAAIGDYFVAGWVLYYHCHPLQRWIAGVIR